MRPLMKLTWIEMKLFVREPAAFFFTLVFPLILLVIFGGIFGNTPDPVTHLGPMDHSVPGYIGMIIGSTGLIALPTVLASYREQGFLRRFEVTPVRPFTVLVSQVLVQTAATTVGALLLVIAGRLLYDLQLPKAPFSVLCAFLLGSFSLYAIGFLLAALSATNRTANAVGMAIYFPMMFLSGAAMPIELMPERIRQMSEYLPLKHVISLLAGLWYGDGWDYTALLVLSLTLLLGAGVSVRRFHWQRV